MIDKLKYVYLLSFIKNSIFEIISVISSKNVVFVYQMGKVGSQSIRESLKTQGITAPHKHRLTYKTYKEYDIDFMKRPIYILWLRKLLAKVVSKKKNLKIITLVREPIQRNISEFFQHYNELNYKGIYKGDPQEVFLSEFPQDIPLNWFDDELKKVFGIDIYKYPFDREKGFTIISENNLDLLVIKLEELDNLEKQIGKFVGLKEFRLDTVNRASKKPYGEFYKYFKRNLKFTENYIEEMYNSKYMTHFYTQEEINAFKEKWKESIKDTQSV